MEGAYKKKRPIIKYKCTSKARRGKKSGTRIQGREHKKENPLIITKLRNNTERGTRNPYVHVSDTLILTVLTAGR